MMKHTENAFLHSPHHCVARRRDHRRFSDVADSVGQQISEKGQFLSED